MHLVDKLILPNVIMDLLWDINVSVNIVADVIFKCIFVIENA